MSRSQLESTPDTAHLKSPNLFSPQDEKTVVLISSTEEASIGSSTAVDSFQSHSEMTSQFSGLDQEALIQMLQDQDTIVAEQASQICALKKINQRLEIRLGRSEISVAYKEARIGKLREKLRKIRDVVGDD